MRRGSRFALWKNTARQFPANAEVRLFSLQRSHIAALSGVGKRFVPRIP